MTWPRFMRGWARRRLERMLPVLEAELTDLKIRRVRPLNTAVENLWLDRAIEKKRHRVDKATAVLAPDGEGEA